MWSTSEHVFAAPNKGAVNAIPMGKRGGPQDPYWLRFWACKGSQKPKRVSALNERAKDKKVSIWQLCLFEATLRWCQREAAFVFGGTL